MAEATPAAVDGAAASSSSGAAAEASSSSAAAAAAAGGGAPQVPDAEPKAESLRPGGGLRPQRFGGGDGKSKGAGGNGAAGAAGAGAGAAGNNRPGGGAARRPYGVAKGPAEPKPKPQPPSAAGAGGAASDVTADADEGDEPKAAEKQPEKPAPKTEADAKTADGQHRLQSQWTFWFDKPQGHTARRVKGATAATEVYESSLREVGSFDTVEGFWRHFNFMRKPSDLDVGANYHLFKTGVKPMWEDKANAHGGKWQVRVKDRHQLDEFWQNLVLALVGETADDGDDVCGVVMSRRRGGDRLAVWTRRKDEAMRPLGIMLKQLMLDDPNGTKKTSAGVALEFSMHESSMKSGSSYATDVVFTV